MRLAAAASLSILALTGCALTPTAKPTPASAPTFNGNVHGGQQPIVGSHVYLFAAGTTGYGGNGIAPSAANASVSLLSAAVTGLSDSVGAYVLTDAGGNFSIPTYSCTPGQQVYLYALGGDPGAGVNSAAGLLAILGNCPSSGNLDAAVPYAFVNEVTTVAAAYAFAGFASDATHVGSSGTTLANTGIANAFGNAANLADVSNLGQALAVTPAGDGTTPQSLINTLANILAPCVNSSGPTTTQCSTLFTNAQSAGSSGTVPADSASAAINIAHNPAANITNLFALSVPSPPFLPTLAKAPSDYTVGIQLAGANIIWPEQIVIDALGNPYFYNTNRTNIIRLTPSGAFLPVTGGYVGTNTSYVSSLAVDRTGNLWIVVNGDNSVIELDPSGAYISPPQGFTGGGLYSPISVAIDASNNAWVDNRAYPCCTVVRVSGSGSFLSGSLGFQTPIDGEQNAIDGSGSVWMTSDFSGYVGVGKLSSTGAILSPSNGYSGGGASFPGALAIDGFGNAWVVNNNNSVSKFSNSGAPLSPPAGFTGGGLKLPSSIALDGAGNVWIANISSVSAFSNQGTALSPTTGYAAGIFRTSSPNNIALDSSGDVWITSGDPITGPTNLPLVTELIGIATPVITPIAAGLAPTTATLPATTLPWSNAGGANFSFYFDSSATDGTAPIVIPTPSAGSVVTLTLTGTATVDGAVHAASDAGPVTPVLFYPGQFVPSASIVVGAFTDASGNVLASGGPVNIGASTVLTVPAGAAQLQLGINAYNGTFSSNSGAFTVSYNVSVNGSSNLGTRP